MKCRHGYRYPYQLKQSSGLVRRMFGKLSIAGIVLLICMVSLFTLKSSTSNPPRSEVFYFLFFSFFLLFTSYYLITNVVDNSLFVFLLDIWK